MKWKLINNAELKTYAVFDDGDEVVSLLENKQQTRYFPLLPMPE